MTPQAGNTQNDSSRSERQHRSSVTAVWVSIVALLVSAPALAGQPETNNELQCGAQVAAVSGQPVVGTIRLKILLVEFQDIRCRKNGDGFSPRYSSKDFENLLGSEGTYVSPLMHSPDGDPVYGSMDDYFRAMSGGRMDVQAEVINMRDESTGLPVWITLPFAKEYYESDRKKDSIFIHAERAAISVGLDVATSTDAKLAIIYAGNTYYQGGGLNPVTWGNRYTMSEVQGRPYNQENPTARFSRIGIHCHEFAHTIGIGHSSGSGADLMCSGTKNGSAEGNMPAPLNPIARIKVGWANVIPAENLTGGEIDISYSLQLPVVYQMKNSNGDYFLIENRRFDQTMAIGATIVPDYNNAAFFPPGGPHGKITQGIFVWRVNATGDVRDPGYSTEGLVYASGRFGRTYPENIPSETDDGVPFPGVSDTRVISPWSDPRNPYTKETDYFGSGALHYTLFVPNTKGGSSCGMEILSEDKAQGSFRVRFFTENPPNPALDRADAPDSLGALLWGRTVCHDSLGTAHQLLEVGGEIFYRTWVAGNANSYGTCQLSNGKGGNRSPSITMAGRSTIAVWQLQASGAGNYVIHSRVSTDGGITWSELARIASAYGCTDAGPGPCVAGNTDGMALLVYGTSSSIFSSLSHNSGKTWGAPVRAFSFKQISESPSVLVKEDSAGRRRHAWSFARTAVQDSSQIYYGVFDFAPGHGGMQENFVHPSARYAGFTHPFLTNSGGAAGEQCVVLSGVPLITEDGGRNDRICREVENIGLETPFHILRGWSVRIFTWTI